MIISGFYKLTNDYYMLLQRLGGIYNDNKERPIYCCMKDKYNDSIFWAIPTSDVLHRTDEQLKRIQFFCALPDRDIRSCYYHIGHTNRPAIFKISRVLPIIQSYISGEYTSQGAHLILKNESLITNIEKKLARILFDEQRHPNKYEQHITTIYTYLLNEISKQENF